MNLVDFDYLSFLWVREVPKARAYLKLYITFVKHTFGKCKEPKATRRRFIQLATTYLRREEVDLEGFLREFIEQYGDYDFVSDYEMLEQLGLPESDLLLWANHAPQALANRGWWEKMPVDWRYRFLLKIGAASEYMQQLHRDSEMPNAPSMAYRFWQRAVEQVRISDPDVHDAIMAAL